MEIQINNREEMAYWVLHAPLGKVTARHNRRQDIYFWTVDHTVLEKWIQWYDNVCHFCTVCIEVSAHQLMETNGNNNQ